MILSTGMYTAGATLGQGETSGATPDPLPAHKASELVVKGRILPETNTTKAGMGGKTTKFLPEVSKTSCSI